MPVTKDVIRDLLPVYAAGEATADTRALVEEFLAQDAELRALAEAARRVEIPAPPAGERLQSLEVASLQRTRRLLARKSFVLGIATLFSFLPLTSMFHGRQLVFLLARDQPDLAFSLVLNAIVAWIVFLDTCRRLRATGLQASQSWPARFCWGLTGLLLGVSAMLVARHWAGAQGWLYLIPLVFLGIALWLGEWMGRGPEASPGA